MVYDIACRYKDIFPIGSLSDLANFETFTPIADDFEPELKLLVGTPSHFTPAQEIRNPTAQLALRKMAKKGHAEGIESLFTTLHDVFNTVSSGGRLHILGQDGLHPRDYTLVSLGMDTVKEGRPTREIAQNGYQYRERFSLLHHPQKRVERYDACAKTLLSATQKGDCRKEFEAGCADHARGFNIFRKIENLPRFFYKIDPGSLCVEAICMTSRASFFSLMKIPERPIFALLEHCCDSNLFTTPSRDVIIGADNEWETEVKGFFGNDLTLASCDGQRDLVNLCFREIMDSFRRCAGKAVHQHNESKMERAMNAVDAFYSTHGPTTSPRSPYIPPGISHALRQRIRPCSILSDTAPLYLLARELRLPESLLPNVEIAKASVVSSSSYVLV